MLLACELFTLANKVLREREGDVRMLGQFFLQRFGAQANKIGLAFDQEALRTLNRHPWPGNVRQLENCVRRGVIMCEGKRITIRDLDLSPAGQGPLPTLKDARENFERNMIQKALRKHSGKIAPAAAELGLSRPTLYDLMDKLGIAKE
jgi:two-component system NtrC family response regulator